MANTTNLSNAQKAKKDEFYTQLSDINAEMTHYEKQFKGKTILMNCDDPTWSNFWHYFHTEFDRLGLKKIIATHYEPDMSPSYKMEYEGGNDEDCDEGICTNLKENGDFRSPECVALLDEADIVITNPPFSLFREYIALLIEHNKQFIVWSNNNAITYKEVFPLIRDNKMWLGYMTNKTCIFRVGDGYEYDEKVTNKINDGHKYGKVPAISVFTNLDIKKRHDILETTYSYAKKDILYPDLYPKYVNYDAIEVHDIATIPMDYDGVMGVPITFLGQYNPDQFEIIGNSLELCKKMSEIANKGEYMQGGVRPYIELQNGNYKYKRLYDRLFIKRKAGK